MKINPALLAPTPPPPRQAEQASDARRAFEALLSASISRTRAQQVAVQQLETNANASFVSDSVTPSKSPDTSELPLQRPGRVLDIKV